MESRRLRQQLTDLTYEAFAEKFQVLFDSPQTTRGVLYRTLDPQHAFYIENAQTLQGFAGYCDHQGSYYHFPPQILRSFLSSGQFEQTLKRLGYFQSTLTPNTFYIEALAVAPSARRQGIAEKLLNYCQHYAREHGYKQLALDVASCNIPAKTLYKKMGFSYHQHRQVPYELFGFQRFDHLICPL